MIWPPFNIMGPHVVIAVLKAHLLELEAIAAATNLMGPLFRKIPIG